MPRPKTYRAFTVQPAHSEAANDEWQDGIERFLHWANQWRTRKISEPAVSRLNAALESFNAGEFPSKCRGLPRWAAIAYFNIMALLRDGHWHVTPCRWCDRWFIAKDRRRAGSTPSCKRPECIRARDVRKKARARKARRELDRGLVQRARRTF